MDIVVILAGQAADIVAQLIPSNLLSVEASSFADLEGQLQSFCFKSLLDEQTKVVPIQVIQGMVLLQVHIIPEK